MRMEDTKKFIKSQLEFLKSERSRYEDEWRETSALLKHRVNEPSSLISKTPIYNTTPIDAINTTCRGVAGYLLSPSIRWFKFVIKGEHFEKSDSLYGANDWLDDVTTLMYSLYSNSRFYATSLQGIEDAIVTGTSYEMITDNNGKIVFNTYNPYECYGAEDENGEPNMFFREYTLTVRQAYSRFGDKLPSELLRNMEENPNTECKFIHAIYPRKYYSEGIAIATKKRFASVHYSYMGDKIVDESGYDEFPLAIHRWEKSDGCFYGRGLATKYLPEIKALNHDSKMYMTGVDFQASPIMFSPENLKGRFIYRPGVVNFGNPALGKPEIVPNSLNINYLAQHIAESEVKLNRLLFADLFNVLMRQERQRTATEVNEIKGEGLVLLSAIIGNMQVEKLNPLVIRTFRIMLKSGMLPSPPEELIKASKSGRVEVELDGPLAQTMKAYHQATGLEQGLGAIASMAQLFPDTMVNFDSDEIARQFATSKGLPQSCIREISDRDKIKQQMAQSQAQAQQQQQALEQSQVLKNLGYSASSIVPEMNNDTQRL